MTTLSDNGIVTAGVDVCAKEVHATIIPDPLRSLFESHLRKLNPRLTAEHFGRVPASPHLYADADLQMYWKMYLAGFEAGKISSRGIPDLPPDLPTFAVSRP
jgi:hypothetical protein